MEVPLQLYVYRMQIADVGLEAVRWNRYIMTLRTASKTKLKEKLRKQRTWRLSLTASAPEKLKIFCFDSVLSVQRVICITL